MKEEKLAQEMFERIPPLMSMMRSEVRACAQGSITVPQFRVLANVQRGLNHVVDIAQHHGVSQPSMTKLVNNLVSRGLIRREPSESDGRVMNLFLTQEGDDLFKCIKKQAFKSLAKKLKLLEPKQVDELQSFISSVEIFVKHFSVGTK